MGAPLHPNKRQKKWKQSEQLPMDVAGYLPQRYHLPPGHYSNPSPQILFSNNGLCRLLSISSADGSLQWNCPVDLSTLTQSLSQTVKISQGSVEVYREDYGNPGRGKELNRPCTAIVRLHKSLPTVSLMKQCSYQDCDFVKVEGCKLTIHIRHFTKFSFGEAEQPVNPPFPPPPIQSRSELLPRQGSPIEMIDSSEATNMDLVHSLIFSKLCKLTQEGDGRGKPIPPPYRDVLEGLEYESGLRERAGFRKSDSDTKTLTMLKCLLRGEGSKVSSQFYKGSNKPFSEIITIKGEGCFKKKESLNLNGFQQILRVNRREVEVWDSDVSLEARRLIALHKILFEEEIRFKFEAVDREVYLGLPSNPTTLTSVSCRVKQLKRWLVWVAQTYYDSASLRSYLGDSILLAAICTRQQYSLLTQLSVNNKWEDLNILVNIQDPAFRSAHQSSDRISPELAALLNCNFNRVQPDQWPLQLMLSLCCCSQSLSEAMGSIIRRLRGQVSVLPLQFYLLQIFCLRECGSMNSGVISPSLSTSEQLFGLYYVWQEMGISYGEKEGRRGKKMRYRLIEKIVSHSQGWQPQQRGELVDNDKVLSTDQKQHLKKSLTLSSTQHISIPLRQPVDIPQSFQHLQCIFSHQKWTIELRMQAYHLITQPHMICSYSRVVLCRLESLLRQKEHQFEDILCIIRLSQRCQMAEWQVIRLCRLFRGEGQFGQMLGSGVKRVLGQGVSRLFNQASLTHSPLARLLEQKSIQGDLVRNVIGSQRISSHS